MFVMNYRLLLIFLHLAVGNITEIDKSPLRYSHGTITYSLEMKEALWVS